MDEITKIARALKNKYAHVSIVDKEKEKVEMVPIGNLTFDLIAEGGIPWGHNTEFIGFSQSGKSLVCQMILANAQKLYNAVGVIVDRENALTKVRAKQLGVDTKRLIKATPADTPTPLDAFQFIIDTIALIRAADVKEKRQPTYIVPIIDSVGAFGKDVDLSKADAGRTAKFVKEGLRELFVVMDDRIMPLIVNHFYYGIGTSYGDPKKQGGGEGLKFFNTVRIALEDRKRIIDTKRGNEVVGTWLGAEVIKTRLGPCYRTGFFPFYYKTGIPYYGGYARLLAQRGYLSPNNKQEFKSFKQSTLTYGEGDDKVEVNEHRIEKFLEKHPELLFKKFPEYKDEDVKEEEMVSLTPQDVEPPKKKRGRPRKDEK